MKSRRPPAAARHGSCRRRGGENGWVTRSSSASSHSGRVDIRGTVGTTEARRVGTFHECHRRMHPVSRRAVHASSQAHAHGRGHRASVRCRSGLRVVNGSDLRAAASHARANVQSRLMVPADRPSSSAASSVVRPARKRSWTTCAARGKLALNSTRAWSRRASVASMSSGRSGAAMPPDVENGW